MDDITWSSPRSTADQECQETAYRIAESLKDAESPFLLSLGRIDREQEGEHTSLDAYRHSGHSRDCSEKYSHFDGVDVVSKSPSADAEVL